MEIVGLSSAKLPQRDAKELWAVRLVSRIHGDKVMIGYFDGETFITNDNTNYPFDVSRLKKWRDTTLLVAIDRVRDANDVPLSLFNTVALKTGEKEIRRIIGYLGQGTPLQERYTLHNWRTEAGIVLEHGKHIGWDKASGIVRIE